MKVRAAEIADRLSASTEQVAAMLLPGGKREGNFWTAGDTRGCSGSSLKVYLTGGKRGRWADYATDEHGDLLDLWAAARMQSMSEAMRDAAEWLGIADVEFREPKRTFSKPKQRYGELSATHRKWLNGRGITDEVIGKLKIGSDGEWIAFPFFRDGELVAVKYRTTDKKMRAESGCEPCLYGWQAIPDRARSVCIVEGEIDAASMLVYGMPTLSVPNGGGNKQHVWIEQEFDRLNRFDRIYLAMDQDEPGQIAQAEIIDRIGAERCRVVELPKKDANECLMAGMRKEAFRELFKHSQTIDPQELKRASDFRQALHQEFYGETAAQTGFAPPFDSMQESLRHRPGEVIVLAGENGTGKSQYAGHLMLEAMRSDFRVCVASMEFKPQRMLKRMARQAGANPEPQPEYLDAIVDYWNERLWIFSVTGTAKTESMIRVFKYARERYGVKVFLIDNLAKCGIDEDDYNAQKAFVDRLTDFAKETDAIVFLVHHMRKGGEDKQGIKGTGAITDMVDTVIIIWRNKQKEDDLREEQDEERRRELERMPDGAIRCRKQRNYEGVEDGEPSKKIWFDQRSYQFLGGPDCRAFQYVKYSRLRAAI